MSETKRTPGPWHWTIEDYSMAILEGPSGSDGSGHVLCVHPCKNCQEHAKKAGNPEWEWGKCTTPTEANADFIVRACNAHDDLLAAAKMAVKDKTIFYDVGPALLAAIAKAE